MNSDDDLDAMIEDRLSEVFAIEVCKWREGFEAFPPQRRMIGDSLVGDLPRFSTDANAVLPWIETKLRSCDASHHRVTGLWTIEIDGHSASSPAFARTACIALIRSERSKL